MGERAHVHSLVKFNFLGEWVSCRLTTVEKRGEGIQRSHDDFKIYELGNRARVLVKERNELLQVDLEVNQKRREVLGAVAVKMFIIRGVHE